VLWYKSWLETRWRFGIGLALLMLSAAGTVFAYPQVARLFPVLPNLDTRGEIGRAIAESIELARSYRGYVWGEWFRQNMPQNWTIFAVLLGTGGLLSQASGGGALFTLSLPASRGRLIGVRAATALAELLVLALIPSLMIPLFSPAIGEAYGFADALVHGICLFTAGTVFFSLTFLLSTVFNDVWRPPLIVLCGATALAIAHQVFRGFSAYSLIGVMSAESWFRSGSLPWFGLLLSAALSGALLYAAVRNIERQDF
jgi:ABC-type transport system involved in multi-copper enzyme maturation permease subunit